MANEKCQECGLTMPSGEPLYLIDHQKEAVCKFCYAKFCPPCPYCSVPLKKRPKAKTNCPNCDRPIFVRTTQILFGSELLTEEQANEVDSLQDSELWRFDRDSVTHLYTKIVGITHRNRDGTLRSQHISLCRVGDQLDLDTEEDNPVDPNAIAVRRKSGGQLGYLKAELAAAVAVLIKRSFRFGVFITRIKEFDDGGLSVGLLILSSPPGISDEEVQRYADAIPRDEILNYESEDREQIE